MPITSNNNVDYLVLSVYFYNMMYRSHFYTNTNSARFLETANHNIMRVHYKYYTDIIIIIMTSTEEPFIMSE